MGFKSRFMNFIGLPDEEEELDADDRRHHADSRDDEYEAPEPPAPDTRRNGRSNIVSIHSQKSIRVVLNEPRSYEEAQEIADHLRSRRPVVVNLQRVRPEHGIRIVDFLSGTVYALNGSISKIGPNIFLCTPDTVEIQGAITEMLDREQDFTH
ncbi:cell division protein SepF [Paenibacillus thermoaerophilus]|uniref:Cell division protein SepF n=1 Tax=Paenibacillus thermoaerophilus TaxID=1215385 RepID=A0ABW2UXS2_9BACL|nr:cell division protein SepF [Paenibacillus thermoaerophilus]TMV19091.1 cell division protein SepF [Paenibacillus thermoaerophilus]